MEAISIVVFDILENENFKIWPNPVKSVIHFQTPNHLVGGIAQIIDMKGNIRNSFPLYNSNKHEFSVKKLQAGTYLLNIISSEKQINKLFLKKE